MSETGYVRYVESPDGNVFIELQPQSRQHVILSDSETRRTLILRSVATSGWRVHVTSDSNTTVTQITAKSPMVE